MGDFILNVIGNPRSGSSLTMQMLDAIEAIGGPPPLPTDVEQRFVLLTRDATEQARSFVKFCRKDGDS